MPTNQEVCMLDENVIAELADRKVITDTFRRLHPDKKLQVYRAAIGLFGRYGFDGLAVNRICREAGISKGSFFQYFESKSHLLEFTILLFDDYLTKWLAGIRSKETAGLARHRLKYLYQSLVTEAELHRHEQMFFLFVTHGLEHAGVVLEGIDLERHIREYVEEIVSRGVVTGEVRGDYDADLTGWLVATIIAALLRRQFAGPGPDHDRIADYLTSFLFDGIKA
jgi:AcrR family transcriptional regulator